MKTKRPYLQTAYCPSAGCWRTWTITLISGMDESAPVVCPYCGSGEARLSDYRECDGERIREIEFEAAKIQAEEEAKKAAEDEIKRKFKRPDTDEDKP